MTPATCYTVRLYPIYPHPEIRLSDNAVAFGVRCYWLFDPAAGKGTGRIQQDCRLATDQYYTIIPRSVYQAVGMRVDALSHSRVTWQGTSCQHGRVRFGLVAEELPHSVGETGNSNRRLVPCEMSVLLPDQDPPDCPCQVILGTSVLVQLEALVRLDCLLPGSGEILIPRSRRRA